MPGKQESTVEAKKPVLFKTEHDKFKLTKFYLDPINDKLSSKSQWNAMPRYEYDNVKGKNDLKNDRNGQNFALGTGAIKLTKGGIPKIHPEFRKTDNDRCFFWFGLDEKQKSSQKVFDILKGIDEYFEEEITNKQNENGVLKQMKDGVAKKYVLPKGQKFVYQHMVKRTEDMNAPSGNDGDDNEEENQENAGKTSNFEPYDRVRVRFNTVYEGDKAPDAPRKINTSLFIGKNVHPMPISSVPEFEKYLEWNSTSHFVLMINKFWVARAAKPSGKDKIVECGFTMKCTQIVLVDRPEHSKGQSQSEAFSMNVFADELDDDKLKNADDANVVEDKQDSVHSDDDNDDDEDDEDEEEKSEKEDKKKVSKNTEPEKKVKKQSTPPEDNEEENKSEDESDESSEESEEEKPVVKNTKGKGNKKQDDDEEEEEKPVAKNTKGKDNKKQDDDEEDDEPKKVQKKSTPPAKEKKAKSGK